MELVLTVLGAFFLFWLQNRLHCLYWYRRLETSIAFQEESVLEGDETVLVETITNRKVFPLTMLQVKFKIHKALRFVNTENSAVTDYSYRNDIFSVMPYEKIIRRLPIQCMRRGYYVIQEMDLISNDLFQIGKEVRTVPVNTVLHVFPGAVDTSMLYIPYQNMMGTVLTKRCQFEDPFELRGIRQYEIYDTMKDINWKASAKTGDLKVNVHNYTASQKVTILLNLEYNENWKNEKLLEESIRIASSYASALLRQGIPVALISNGVDAVSHLPVSIRSGSGSGHESSLKRRLARMNIEGRVDSFTPYIESELAAGGKDMSLYILISTEQGKNMLRLYDQLCAQNSGSQWIAPLHTDLPMHTEFCPSAVTMKWEVPYA